MTIHAVKTNFSYDASAVRAETHEGAQHLVVPVVMIVEGVLNGALLLAEEFGAFPHAWNGIPVPVLHPEENGQSISANRPDIVDRNTIGRVYNTHVDDKKLKAELWLNTAKAEALGYGDLVKWLADGNVMEVSTGYFANDDPSPGEYNGRPYDMIHRAIRPDHLALLPGQIGACSVEDGCGTRINSKRSSLTMKVNEAWSVLSKHFGLNTNCECEEQQHMDILEKAQGLVKANALDAKQLAAIQAMSPEDRKVMAAFIAALGEGGGEVDDMPDDMADDTPAPPADEPAANAAAIDKLVANAVADHLRRHDVVGRLRANERNTLTEAQLAAMSVEQLEAVEQMIRPADYSGAGGFASNAQAPETTVTPLRPSGVLAAMKKKGA